MIELATSTPEECERWESSIDEEYQAPGDMETWALDDHPKSRPLSTHMLQTVKRKFDGLVDRFKSRTDAGSKFQTFGQYYQRT